MPILRLAVALSALAYGSYTDWRTRTAPDSCWLAMGAAGLIILATEMVEEDWDPALLLMLIPIGWFFFDLLIERRGIFEGGVNVPPLALYVVSMAIIAWFFLDHYHEERFWALLSVPLMFLLYFVLYIIDVIKGGADAKALIALSLLIPWYPVMDGLPLLPLPSDVAQYIMPFSLLTLFYGAILTMVVPVYYFILNMVRGDRRFPSMFFGVRMDISEAKKRFVWPMDYIDGDEVRTSSLPKGPESLEEHFASLESKGLTRIWVTPKIPMLIPLTLGLVIAAVVGNVIFFFI
ncbi:MAG: prepilin peptidase [Methanomassiliicoccales archaeon]|nr:MAG: prepilin peptidase [Methanomassiliicoccales archaeon]